MMDVAEEKDVYLESFARLNRSAGRGPDWLTELRQEAIERFAELGFPSRTDEEWRFTNLAPLTRTSFVPANGALSPNAGRILSDLVIDAGTRPRLVFVNGRYDHALSRPASEKLRLGRFSDFDPDELK